MVLIAQKEAGLEVVIGPGYSTSPNNYVFDPRRADRAGLPLGLSAEKFVYTTFYEDAFYGHWTFDPGSASETWQQYYFGGRGFSLTLPETGVLAYAYTQNIADERSGEILSLTTTESGDKSYSPALSGGIYFAIGNGEGAAIVAGYEQFSALTMPLTGDPEVLTAFTLPVGYTIAQQLSQQNTQLATRHIAGDHYQTLVRLREGVSGPLKWFLLDYTLGGSSSYEEFKLSDATDDDDINLVLTPAMYGADEIKLFADANGWLLTVDGTNTELVRTLRYFQLSADLSAYRELTPVGEDETLQMYLDNFPFYPLTDADGRFIMLLPLAGMVLSGGEVVAPMAGDPPDPPATGDPALKGWGVTLDGHDFYVLKLGMDGKTLVYDLASKQWAWWTTGDSSSWRPAYGLNWDSAGSIAQNFGSNIVVGDDTTGTLWSLDPDYGLDDDAVTGAPGTFPRVATAQLPVRGRDVVPMFSVFLTASAGQPALTANEFELLYSDDVGDTYISAGVDTVVEDDYEQEFTWRSLGQARAPGRLMRITDNGSFARIDSLNVNEE